MKIIRNGKIVRLAAGGGPDWQAPGVRKGVNLAEPGAIKVNQGKSNHFFENKGAQEELEGCLVRCGDGPSPPRGMQGELADCPLSWGDSQPQSVPLRAGQSLSQRDRLYQPRVYGS